MWKHFEIHVWKTSRCDTCGRGASSWGGCEGKSKKKEDQEGGHCRPLLLPTNWRGSMPNLSTYTHASSNQCEQPLCPTSYLCRPRFNIRNGKTGSCTDGQISTSHCELGIINETLKVEKILIFCKYWQGHDKVRWAQRCFLVFGQTGHCPRPRAPFANVSIFNLHL